MKKLGLRVTSYWHKSRKYNSYKGKVGKVAEAVEELKDYSNKQFQG
ncbi:protein of unknown function (plasmid) [Carnobacterium divergens]|nr:protein of unknown function [Carnobacterium divergens]